MTITLTGMSPLQCGAFYIRRMFSDKEKQAIQSLKKQISESAKKLKEIVTDDFMEKVRINDGWCGTKNYVASKTEDKLYKAGQYLSKTDEYLKTN